MCVLVFAGVNVMIIVSKWAQVNLRQQEGGFANVLADEKVGQAWHSGADLMKK